MQILKQSIIFLLLGLVLTFSIRYASKSRGTLPTLDAIRNFSSAENTGSEKEKIVQDEIEFRLGLLFGSPPPRGLNAFGGGSSTSQNDIGKIIQIRAEYDIPKTEFHERVDLSSWRQIQFPKKYMESAHLSKEAAKLFIKSYAGKIGTVPAKLFWCEDSESFLLELNY